jgi:23S rRNA (guanosine2251-2'-O)-methyltransferase
MQKVKNNMASKNKKKFISGFDHKKQRARSSASKKPGKRLDHQDNNDDSVLLVKGRHEVLNALESRQKIETVFVSASVNSNIEAQIRAAAKAEGILVKELPLEVFSAKFGTKCQGVVAVQGAFEYSDFEELIKYSSGRRQVLVALNQVEDARNLGAIVRTVEAAGCDGIVIPKHRAAGMTEWAVRTAQGAASYLKVSRVTNMADAIARCKTAGFWAVGLDAAAKARYCDVVYNRPILLVAGGENVGLGERVRKSCDELISLPLSGKVTSLNVSVSTAIALFEICRQKDFFSK